jgi:hypothetical protein
MRKSTPYGRRVARLARAGLSLKSDGITMTRQLNTRLSPLEIERIILPCKQALQAMREARATHDQWVVLCTARHVGIAIEDGGVIRGQRFLFDEAEAALEQIGDRCVHSVEGWKPCACFGRELSALADMVNAHSRQVHELTYGEYTRAADLALSRVETNGGQVYIRAKATA